MSANTPQPPDTIPPAQAEASGSTPTDRLVLEYLRSRGHVNAVKALSEVLGADVTNTSAKPSETAVSSEDLLKGLTVYAQKASRPGENSFKEGSSALQELKSLGNSSNIHSLLASLGSIGAEEILSADPTDKQEGFRELEYWVEGSLDMYRPEFRPILFPIFCHFYLELVQRGFKDAALKFFSSFSHTLAPAHNPVLHHLSTLLLPTHVQNDELSQRFQNEKYVIKMSRSGFGLLVGWLTEGVGGEPVGSGEGFSGESGKRGRAAVMRVVNNHLRFDVTAASTSTIFPSTWEESTGLLTSLIPGASSSSTSIPNPQAFNSSKGELKLGPAPISEELRAETDRVLREHAMLDRDPAAQYDTYSRLAAPQGLVSPVASDMPPLPPSFKTLDVQREVEKVRDHRKRIRIEPSTLNSVDLNSAQGSAARARGLPSICAYTLHDVGEGSPCSTFSPDVSLMAAGFAESHIRLWSLKGEKLKALKNDISPNSIRDSTTLLKLQEKDGPTSRKLIGHSGPVYSVAFDPLSGSAAPPRFLLSASADTTARLWSLNTYTNVVSYRGHQNPIWDTQWSPMGIYFATGSRDRTARLWSTDRISCLRIYAGHLNDVNCVRFHPNSLYLATGSSDWTARLWDVQRGTCVRVFIGHRGALSTLAMSPDGRYLASAGEDLAINLWDLGSGRRIKKMTGHTASIYSLSFSAESSLLVSGGADWTVRCWDVKSSGGLSKPKENGASDASAFRTEENDGSETSDLVATFPTKRTPILNVHFTPRNLCLAAGVYLNPDSK